MNKLSMRARKLDNSKPLRVFYAEEVPDLEEHSQYGRSVLQIATGVEKEEEDEHHLQAVISASLLDTPNSKQVYIPIPDASTKISHYSQLYPRVFVPPKTLIRHPQDVEFNEVYDLDFEDFEWLQKLNKSPKKVTEDQFENLITQFEGLVKDKKELPNTFQELGPLTTNVPPSVLPHIYNYWKLKRAKLKSGSLLYPLKPEINPNDPDPYVCFRKRELKPLRKARRNDAQSFEKMVKLRNEIERAKAMLELVKKRDRMKKESLSLDFLIFEQKAKIWDLRRLYQIPTPSNDSEQLMEQKKLLKKKNSLTNPSKLKISINGGSIRTPPPESQSNLVEEAIVNLGVPEEAEIDTRVERQLAGIDPFQPNLPPPETVGVDTYLDIYDKYGESAYEDLTDTKLSIWKKRYPHYNSSNTPFDLWQTPRKARLGYRPISLTFPVEEDDDDELESSPEPSSMNLDKLQETPQENVPENVQGITTTKESQSDDSPQNQEEYEVVNQNFMSSSNDEEMVGMEIDRSDSDFKRDSSSSSCHESLRPKKVRTMRFLGRRRVGRGGRVWYDRSMDRNSRKAISNFGFSDSEDEELDLSSDLPRTFISVPLPFYTLNELSILNGMTPVTRNKLK